MTVKSRLLELLEQHKGETLSGEDIGRELSCTRAAVWKAVNSLRQEGYPIEAGPNKGYMLTRESNLISAEGIRLFLEHPQGEVRIFDEISSTNLEARQLAVSGMAGRTWLFCGCHGADCWQRAQRSGVLFTEGQRYLSKCDPGATGDTGGKSFDHNCGSHCGI